MGWKTICVVQNRCTRQIFTAYRAIDDDLQALDSREDIDRTPVAASAIVIEYEH